MYIDFKWLQNNLKWLQLTLSDVKRQKKVLPKDGRTNRPTGGQSGSKSRVHVTENWKVRRSMVVICSKQFAAIGSIATIVTTITTISTTHILLLSLGHGNGVLTCFSVIIPSLLITLSLSLSSLPNLSLSCSSLLWLLLSILSLSLLLVLLTTPRHCYTVGLH